MGMSTETFHHLTDCRPVYPILRHHFFIRIIVYRLGHLLFLPLLFGAGGKGAKEGCYQGIVDAKIAGCESKKERQRDAMMGDQRSPLWGLGRGGRSGFGAFFCGWFGSLFLSPSFTLSFLLLFRPLSLSLSLSLSASGRKGKGRRRKRGRERPWDGGARG